jgi:hypothetical protein
MKNIKHLIPFIGIFICVTYDVYKELKNTEELYKSSISGKISSIEEHGRSMTKYFYSKKTNYFIIEKDFKIYDKKLLIRDSIFKKSKKSYLLVFRKLNGKYFLKKKYNLSKGFYYEYFNLFPPSWSN